VDNTDAGSGTVNRRGEGVRGRRGDEKCIGVSALLAFSVVGVQGSGFRVQLLEIKCISMWPRFQIADGACTRGIEGVRG
jgi:hypothetical protein